MNVEEGGTIMGKVPKGKGKTRAKMENLENVLRSKITNRQTAFKLRFEAIVDVFYQGRYLHE